MENPKGSNQEGMTGGRGNFPTLESREKTEQLGLFA